MKKLSIVLLVLATTSYNALAECPSVDDVIQNIQGKSEILASSDGKRWKEYKRSPNLNRNRQSFIESKDKITVKKIPATLDQQLEKVEKSDLSNELKEKTKKEMLKDSLYREQCKYKNDQGSITFYQTTQ